MEILKDQVFVFVYRDQHKYCADIFLALEDWNGISQFKVELLASTNSNEIIGSELLLNPSLEDIKIISS